MFLISSQEPAIECYMFYVLRHYMYMYVCIVLKVSLDVDSVQGLFGTRALGTKWNIVKI